MVCLPRTCAFRLASAPQVYQVPGHYLGPERHAAGKAENAEEIALVENFATRWIGLLLLTTLLAGSVAAEDLPLPDPDGLDLPHDSLLYSYPGDEEPLPSSRENSVRMHGEAPSRLVAPPGIIDEPGPSGPQISEPYLDGSYPGDPEQYEGYELDSAGHNYPWDSQPAPIESSGTWIDRGVWYAEADAVALYRIWWRADVFVGAEDPNVNIPNSFPAAGLGLNTNRTLYIPGAHPGGDAGVRTTLGRFLFRDDQNRDHSAEFTAWSAGDWVSDGTMSSANPNGLFVTFNLDGGNRDFDGSSFQRVIYTSRLNSFELNYRMKRRLGRDRMVMDPNGHWRREASNGFTRNFLAGFRYVEVRETLDWTAQDIIVNGSNGRYLIHTGNELFGFQMGDGIEYQTGRWSVGLSGKLGLFWNHTTAHQQLDFTADDNQDFERRATEAELSFIGDARALVRYHLTPASSLRVGLEFMTLDSLALAPRQISFDSGTSKIETGGQPYYLGGSLGFDFYW